MQPAVHKASSDLRTALLTWAKSEYFTSHQLSIAAKDTQSALEALQEFLLLSVTHLVLLWSPPLLSVPIWSHQLGQALHSSGISLQDW